MLMRTDPFRDLDRLAERLFTGANVGNGGRPVAMPMDAYRQGEEFVVQFDLPGVDPESIDLTVQRNELTVRAERTRPAQEGTELLIAERPYGSFTRQLFLGDNLDTDRLRADYESGVLVLRIPVAEQAKPRRVQIGANDTGSRTIEA